MKRQPRSLLQNLPKEACPMQASLPFGPLLMHSAERHGVDRVSWSVTPGPQHWHREVFLTSLLLLVLKCLLCMQSKEKTQKLQKPKLCYHAKLRQAPFWSGKI